MKELNAYPIMGLFEELYKPELQSLTLEPLLPTGRWALERVNGLFWAQKLCKKSLNAVIKRQ